MTQYDVYYLLFRNKRLIVAGTMLGLVASITAFVLMPRAYRSEARLLVRYVSDTVVIDPAVSGDRVVTPGRMSDSVMATEVEILTSAELIGAVAADLASATPGATNQATLTPRELADNFSVDTAYNGSTFRLYFTGPTPAIAQDVLRRLIDAYLNKHQIVHRDPGVFEFISRQTDEMRTRVNDSEEELRRMRDQAGIVSLAESRELALRRLQNLDQAMRELEGTLAATRARQQSLTEQLGGRALTASPTTEAPGAPPAPSARTLTPAVAEALSRLTELYRRESQLMETYTSNSVPVRSIRRQIVALEETLTRRQDAEPESGERVSAPAPVYASASPLTTDLAAYRAEEAALAAQLEVLKRQFEAAQADLRRVESSEVQIGRMERTRDIYDTNFRYFSQRLEQARIDNALDASKVSNIAIVQPPTLPDRPITRERFQMLAIILGVFTAGGFGMAMLREYVFDHRIRHPHEIQKNLHLPLLASVPHMHKLTRSRGGVAGKSDRAFESACEVVAQLLCAQVEQSEQTLLVGLVAPHKGAGVTTLAERVSHAMQHSGLKKVMLASVAEDGRFTGKMLGEIESQGDDSLSAGSGVAPGSQTMVEELYPVKVSYASPMPITPGVFADFSRNAYDCVIFDLPPLMSSEMAVRLLPRLNGVILVLETLQTRRAEASNCLTQLEQLGSGVYGAVLNKFYTPLPGWVPPPPLSEPVGNTVVDTRGAG